MMKIKINKTFINKKTLIVNNEAINLTFKK